MHDKLSPDFSKSADIRSPLLSPFIIIATGDNTTEINKYVPSIIPKLIVEQKQGGSWYTKSTQLDIPFKYSIIDAPLDTCLAMIAADSTSLKLLMQLHGEWKKAERQSLPPIVSLDAQQHSMHEIYQRMLGLLSCAFQRQADLHNELSELRMQYMDLQNSYSLLEEWIDSNPPQLQLAFSYLPTKHTCILPSSSPQSKPKELKQSLPIPSTGLVRIDLFPDTIVDMEGELICKLFALSSDECVGNWQIPLAKIKNQKLQLLLNQGITGIPESLELRIIFKSYLQSDFYLRLGAKHPSAYSDINGQFSSPLALQLWTTIPGLAPLCDTEDWLETNEKESRRTSKHVMLSLGALKSAQEIMETDDQSNMLTFIPETDELQVHPRTDGLSIAYLPGSIPVGIRRISAMISLAHNDSNTVEFNLILSSERFNYSDIFSIVELKKKNIITSGWTKLSTVASPSKIKAELAQVSVTQLNLYLITRVADESSNAYAWARFSKIACEF